jgi:hypothetical protein
VGVVLGERSGTASGAAQVAEEGVDDCGIEDVGDDLQEAAPTGTRAARAAAAS